jgi:hypothetical protein
MVSIVNASPTNGIVQTADGSGVLKVQSDGKTTNALAWVNFNGTGTVAIRSSYNVSSITDNGTGDYTVNFATALSDANYSVVGQAHSPSSSYYVFSAPIISSANQTTTSVRVGSTVPNTGASGDPVFVQLSIFGN